MNSFADMPAVGESHLRTVQLTDLLLDHLLPFPKYLRQLQCALEDCSTDLQQVCAALESHPGFRKNFVRMASLAESGEPGLSLDHLVLLLGKRRVWNAAIVAFILTQLDGEWATPAMKQLARLALERGANGTAVARLIDGEDPSEEAYVSGVLSLIGLLPLIDSCTEGEQPDWIETSTEALRKQRQLFGTDCLELGHWIRLLWHLPVQLIATAEQCGPPNFAAMQAPLAAYRARQAAEGNLLMMPKNTV